MSAAISAASAYFNSLKADTIVWSPLSGNTPPTVATQVVTAKYVAPLNPPAPFDHTSFQKLDPIDALKLPTPYVVNTTGLFDDLVPQMLTPDFTGTAINPDFTAIDALLATITAPVLAHLEAPTLSDVSVGVLPTVTVPTFDTSVVADDPGVLTNVESRFVAEYDRVLPAMKAFVDGGVTGWISKYAPGFTSGLAALEAKLQDGINRGTALSEDYERALYARSRSRTEVEYTRNVTEIENGHKKRGFEIPPAAMMSGIAQATQATANALSQQATEIAIKRAEQEIQHIQFVLSTSANVRQTMFSTFLQYASLLGQINQQADEHAKTFASILVDSYQAALERYKAQLEVFKTEAAVYETRLKASLAQLDIYRLQLDAAKVTVEIDSLKLESYAKQIQAEVARIEMFTSLLKGVETRSNVEKAKIEIYAEQVKAYVARLGGDEVRTKIYLAALQGDEAKLKGELAKLEAYSKTVGAEVARVKGDAEIQGLRAENNRMLVDLYRAELDAYRSELGAATSVFEGELKGELAVIDAYKTNKLLELDVFRSLLDKDRLTLEKATKQAEMNTNATFKYADLTTQHWQLQANLLKDVGLAYGNVAGAALASQNTMVSQAVAA